MARRDERILNLLVQCPWWVSVILAGAAQGRPEDRLPAMQGGDGSADRPARCPRRRTVLGLLAFPGLSRCHSLQLLKG